MEASSAKGFVVIFLAALLAIFLSGIVANIGGLTGGKGLI